MSEQEKINALKVMTGEQEEMVLSVYLRVAGAKVVSAAYPLGNAPEESKVLEEYAAQQIEIAAYLINKRGAEGEVSHSENGVSRSYESADVPVSMLRGIVPHCSVIGGRKR